MQIEKNEAVGGNINCWVGTWAMSAFGSMNIFFWNWVIFYNGNTENIFLVMAWSSKPIMIL